MTKRLLLFTEYLHRRQGGEQAAYTDRTDPDERLKAVCCDGHTHI